MDLGFLFEWTLVRLTYILEKEKIQIFRHKSLTIAESRQIDGSRYWHTSDMGLPLAAVHRWGSKCDVEKARCIDYLKNSA